MKLGGRVCDEVCELHSDERTRFEIVLSVCGRAVPVAICSEGAVGRVLFVACAFAGGGRWRGGGGRFFVFIFADRARRAFSTSLNDTRHGRDLFVWVAVCGVCSMREGME